jgi:signal transduction histidine kinase
MMDNSQQRTFLEYALSIFVLAIIVTYGYGHSLTVTYPGFDFSIEDSTITRIYTIDRSSQELRSGDKLLQVDNIPFEAYVDILGHPLFFGVQPRDAVTIQVLRGEQVIDVLWIIPSPDVLDILEHLIVFWLPFVVWSAGTATLFLVRPKDERWRLLTASSYLTAVWLAAGLASSAGIWHASEVMRMAIWVGLPVYLHLHWIFPRSLGHLPIPLKWGIYSIGVFLAVGQLLQPLPTGAYYIGFIIALLGSILLLAIHAIFQPDQRYTLRLSGGIAGVIILPSIGIALIASSLIPGTTEGSVGLGWAVILSLPAIFWAYFFTIYRRQSGRLEQRVNRAIVLYVLCSLIITIPTVVNSWKHTNVQEFRPVISFQVMLITIASYAIFFTFPYFRGWIAKRLLTVPMDTDQLSEVFATRLATRVDYSSLIILLRDEILSSILVEQSALLKIEEDAAITTIYFDGIMPNQLPSSEDLPNLQVRIGQHLPTGDNITERFQWIHLILPLKLEDRLIGLWLLGARDPDDYYAKTEINTLQALANQTAVALTNIAQANQLIAIYQANIEREEQERKHLARVLHDDVLNQLAVLSMQVDQSTLSPEANQIFSSLTDHIRQTISELRPAMLSHGLYAAFEELVDDLSARSNGTQIQLDLKHSAARFDLRVEEHLFRIVQQACENAIKHAEANLIRIHGQLEPEVHLVVEDDGVGFPEDKKLDFTELLSQQHFGLAGIRERADLINAEVNIDTSPQKGTRISINWHPVTKQLDTSD